MELLETFCNNFLTEYLKTHIFDNTMEIEIHLDETPFRFMCAQFEKFKYKYGAPYSTPPIHDFSYRSKFGVLFIIKHKENVVELREKHVRRQEWITNTRPQSVHSLLIGKDEQDLKLFKDNRFNISMFLIGLSNLFKSREELTLPENFMEQLQFKAMLQHKIEFEDMVFNSTNPLY